MREDKRVSVWLHIYFCIYIYMYIYLYMNMCIHAHPPILIRRGVLNAWRETRESLAPYIFLYVHIYMYIYIYMYICTHIHRWIQIRSMWPHIYTVYMTIKFIHCIQWLRVNTLCTVTLELSDYWLNIHDYTYI